jgi:hypothetical protein
LQSLTVGVGQSTASDNCPRLWPSRLLPFQSVAEGVGHILAAHVSRLGMPALLNGRPFFVPFCPDPYRLAVGVGYSPRDHEEPVTAVRGADGGCGNAIPRRIVPARGKVTEHDVESPAAEDGDVLDDDRRRSKLSDEARELGPEARPPPMPAPAPATLMS